MNLYTERDVHNIDSNTPTIYVTDHCSDLLYCPTEWQKQGLQQTKSGYGKKLVTTFKINYNKKYYRVYCTCYSNSGSYWFTVKGKKIFIN